MTRPLTVLDTLQIEHPCPENWGAMRGDDRARRCAACKRVVHDLSALTAAEAAALLSGPSVPCVRVHRRADHSVVTRDTATDLPSRLRRVATRALLAAASCVGLTLVTGCREDVRRRVTMGTPKSHDVFKAPAEELPQAPAPRQVVPPVGDGGRLP